MLDNLEPIILDQVRQRFFGGWRKIASAFQPFGKFEIISLDGQSMQDDQGLVGKKGKIGGGKWLDQKIRAAARLVQNRQTALDIPKSEQRSAATPSA